MLLTNSYPSWVLWPPSLFMSSARESGESSDGDGPELTLVDACEVKHASWFRPVLELVMMTVVFVLAVGIDILWCYLLWLDSDSDYEFAQASNPVFVVASGALFGFWVKRLVDHVAPDKKKKTDE